MGSGKDALDAWRAIVARSSERMLALGGGFEVLGGTCGTCASWRCGMLSVGGWDVD